MATKSKPAVAKKQPAMPPVQTTSKPPYTFEERLHRIEVLGKRIDGYVKYMCEIATQAGSSNEVKERAVTVFYDQLIVVEAQLAKIHDELRLE